MLGSWRTVASRPSSDRGAGPAHHENGIFNWLQNRKKTNPEIKYEWNKYMCDRRTLLNHSLTPKIMEASPMSNGPGQAQQWSGSANKRTLPVIFYYSRQPLGRVLDPVCFVTRTRAKSGDTSNKIKTDTMQARAIVSCVISWRLLLEECHATSWVLLAFRPLATFWDT